MECRDRSERRYHAFRVFFTRLPRPASIRSLLPIQRRQQFLSADARTGQRQGVAQKKNVRGAHGSETAVSEAALELAAAPLESRVGEVARTRRKEVRVGGDKPPVPLLNALRRPVFLEMLHRRGQRSGRSVRRLLEIPRQHAGRVEDLDFACTRPRHPSAVRILQRSNLFHFAHGQWRLELIQLIEQCKTKQNNFQPTFLTRVRCFGRFQKHGQLSQALFRSATAQPARAQTIQGVSEVLDESQRPCKSITSFRS